MSQIDELESTLEVPPEEEKKESIQVLSKIVSATNILLFPFGMIIRVIVWLLTLPIKVFTWLIVKIRTRNYDPEKRICPGCGFRGDSGTNGKVCSIKHTATQGPERAANEHSCFRCGATYYSKLFIEADKWIPR